MPVIIVYSIGTAGLDCPRVGARGAPAHTPALPPYGAGAGSGDLMTVIVGYGSGVGTGGGEGGGS